MKKKTVLMEDKKQKIIDGKEKEETNESHASARHGQQLNIVLVRYS